MQNTSAATLLYGKSGTGKTSLLITLAEWVWEKHGLKSRLVTTEPGGFGDMAVALAKAGVLSIFRARSRDPEGKLGLAIGTMQSLSLGWWPAILDPETGMMPEGGELIPPTLERWELRCQNGHTVRAAAAEKDLAPSVCPVCTLATNPSNGKVVRLAKPNPALAGFGAWLGDSLTSCCEWCMQDVNARAAAGTLGGLKGAINTVWSDNQSFGSAGMSGVGFVQERVPQWSANSAQIPGLVVPPVWTAGEMRVSGEREIPVYGPAIVGQAKTEVAPRWFGNCLSAAQVREGASQVWRLYLREWQEAGDEARRPAKVRALPGFLPEYLQDREDEPPFTRFNLGRLFALLGAVQGRADERVKKLLERRPAPVGDTRVEATDQVTDQPAPAPAEEAVSDAPAEEKGAPEPPRGESAAAAPPPEPAQPAPAPAQGRPLPPLPMPRMSGRLGPPRGGR